MKVLCFTCVRTPLHLKLVLHVNNRWSCLKENYCFIYSALLYMLIINPLALNEYNIDFISNALKF